MITRRTLRLAATVGPALVSLAIGVFALVGVQRLAVARDAVSLSRDIAESLQTVLARLTDAETSQRGYLLTGSRIYLAPGEGAAADVHHALASARRLISDSSEQARLDTLSIVIAEKLAELESAKRAYEGPGGLSTAAAEVRSDRGQELMREARALIGNIVGEERARLARRQEHEARLRVLTTSLVFAAILLAGLLSLLVNTILSRALGAREDADRLRQKALSELEAVNRELGSQASEMEAQTVELEQANEELRGVTDDLERQTATAKQAGEQARAEHSRLMTVVEQSPLAISIVEAPSGRRIIANHAAERVFGVPLSTSLADTTAVLKGFKVNGSPLAHGDWPLARAIEGGQPVIDEIIEIERPNGERRRICMNSAPVRDAEGRVEAGVAIFWDVTEQHRAEQELRNARLEAEAASRAKSEFLAVMSHELRTPLAAIIGYEELLFDGITGPVNEGQRTQLGRIKASAAHLLNLIDEVLTLSRVEAGREITHPERISVFMALHEASSLAMPLAAEKGLALEVVRAPKEVEVWADATKLRQILLNLLTNAIKFTDSGSVVLESRKLDGRVDIMVRDTGIGIASADHDRVFDTFWQVEQKSTRKVGGTGLGLSVSRRLARLMNGELTVESRLGAGSTFTLRLPAPRKT
ncbi:MAG TPA: ATP-binding protein [Gemmatimonadaceae bacterium]